MKELAVLLVSGWTSGTSIYLTAAILGIAGRMGWIDLPGGLSALEHPLLIALAVAIYAIEFVADKIPFVDSAWDAVHTFIRPTAAAAAGYLGGTEYGPLAQTGLALFTGTLALDAHAVKSTTRLAINTSPEPFSNIGASLVEHSFVILLFWFCIQHPVIASVIVVLLVIASFFIIRFFWGIGRAVCKQLFKKHPKKEPEAA